MDYRTKILLGVFVFIIAIIGIDKYTKINTQKVINEGEKQTIKVEVKGGEVIKVTSKSFEKEVLNSDIKVLIDFYADWCQPCKMLSPIVEEVASETGNVKFVKINTDYEDKLSNKY